jgi:predicted HTH transcriptional regulator
MPSDLVKKALCAKRESKYVEFKQGFDPNSPEDWCGIIKDIIAIANSGGGIIVFGLDSFGKPTGTQVAAIATVDPADVSDKIAKYTGPIDLEFEIHEIKKGGHSLVAFLIQSVSIPVVFQKPGTFEISPGKQKTAFRAFQQKL